MPIVIKPEKTAVQETEPVAFDRPSSDFNSKMSEITEKKEGGAYEYYYPKNDQELQKAGKHLNKSRKKQWIFGTIIAVLIGIFIVSMMTVFASATVSITPKSQDIDVDMKITGTVGKTAGTVRYEVVKLSESKTASVPATGETAAEIKASGKIVIYNDFSTDPQRLIVRTRFETPNGLIYRIPESVVVPGKTVKNGVDTPGNIETTIFADEAGDKYNIKKSDFTIPGFKSDANRYKNIYARSSTDITGGFVGKVKTVSDTDKQTALQNIDSQAQTELEKNLESKIPEELTLISGSIVYKSEELAPQEESSSVTLEKNVTAYAIMLNKQDLSDQITNEYTASSSDWSNIKSIIKDFSLLKMITPPDNLDTGNNLSLQINGKAKVLADIDTNIIGQRLLGAPKGDVAKLMDEFAGISNIRSAIRPIWKQTFPSNSSKIYVLITDGN